MLICGTGLGAGMASHTVTEPGPRGQPRQVICLAHDGCGWRRDLAGPMGAKDPVVLALLNQHLRESASPAQPMMGHAKRPRP